MKLARTLSASFIVVFSTAFAGCVTGQSNISGHALQDTIDDPELTAKKEILSSVVSDLLTDPEMKEFLSIGVDSGSNDVMLCGEWPTIQSTKLDGVQLKYTPYPEAKKSPRRIIVTLQECKIDLKRDKWEENGLAFHQCPIHLRIPHQGKDKEGRERIGVINVWYDYIKRDGKWDVRFAGAR